VEPLTLLANNPGIYTGRTGNNTYLLPGAEPTLIDAGVGDAAHIDSIAAALGTSPLARVIVTHAHSDHASGATALAARWPAAQFFKMPWPERDTRYAVDWRPLGDGDEIAAGDERLRVIHTPGHAPDHVCLWHESTRALFSGDLAVRGTTVVIPGTHGGSLSDYLRSLERVLALKPRLLLPSHGPAIEDVERLLGEYIAHRLDRERQIADALAGQPSAVDDLLASIYPAIHPNLAQAARDSLVAHLRKLQEDGRAVERSDGRWALVPPPASTC
jgi:glyoxylase-like metal-dependent hydrolase (beta-lactamase superfamily II)